MLDTANIKPGASTPWGRADSVKAIGTIGLDTIYSVETPSHGGYFVPKRLLHRIPQAHQERAARWSGSPQWYEEDCEWASVVIAFPELFASFTLDAAKEAMEFRAKREAEELALCLGRAD